MIYTSKEILKKYGTRFNLSKAIKNKEIFKLEHGIYSDKDLVNPIIIASKKYPNAVITMDSAFYYYNLTDVIQNKIYLATSRNARIIKNQEIEQIFIDKSILERFPQTLTELRSARNVYDSGQITKSALEGFGQGGGHPAMAGGFVPYTRNDEMDALIPSILEMRFLKAISDCDINEL